MTTKQFDIERFHKRVLNETRKNKIGTFTLKEKGDITPQQLAAYLHQRGIFARVSGLEVHYEAHLDQLTPTGRLKITDRQVVAFYKSVLSTLGLRWVYDASQMLRVF